MIIGREVLLSIQNTAQKHIIYISLPPFLTFWPISFTNSSKAHLSLKAA